MGKIVKIDSKADRVKKLQEYSENVDFFLNEYEKAVSLLKKYFKYADDELKLSVIMLLGSFAKDHSGEFCYRIAMDEKEHEMVRDTAALQLGHILRYSDGQEEIMEMLLLDLKNRKKCKRQYAIRALGFEGNHKAALPLVELLYDPDGDIRQWAVNAISNLREPSVVNILKSQLKNGSSEMIKTILFNLWRFNEQKEQIIPIYLDYIRSSDPELRFFALNMIGNISNVDELFDLYSSLITDKDRRIRKITAQRLGESGIKEAKPLLNQMIQDSDMEVKKQALTTFKKY